MEKFRKNATKYQTNVEHNSLVAHALYNNCEPTVARARSFPKPCFWFRARDGPVLGENFSFKLFLHV